MPLPFLLGKTLLADILCISVFIQAFWSNPYHVPNHVKSLLNVKLQLLALQENCSAEQYFLLIVGKCIVLVYKFEAGSLLFGIRIFPLFIFFCFFVFCRHITSAWLVLFSRLRNFNLYFLHALTKSIKGSVL